MTHQDDWDKIFPQERGPKHYKNFKVQPFEFISKNELTFFQGCVVKYACRYKMKDGIKDLEKIIHYCELEIKKMKDTK